MLQSLSWKVDKLFSWSRNSLLLLNQTVCKCVEKKPSTVLYPEPLNPIPTITLNFLRSILILSSLLYICIPSNIFPCGYQPNFVHTSHFFHVCYMFCSALKSCSNHPNNIRWRALITVLVHTNTEIAGLNSAQDMDVFFCFMLPYIGRSLEMGWSSPTKDILFQN
jgi:hypothetical protein